jgi:flagellar motor switch protein FliN/FliY
MRTDIELKAPARGALRLPESVVDNVDVALETYLGGAVMRVAELKALETGGVVTLDSNLNALVELRLNGLTVAHGELVAVGDRFGVRITALAP